MTTPCAPRPASSSSYVDPDEVVDRYRGVADDAVADLEAEVRRDWTFEGEPSADSIDRSLRAAIALEAVVDAHGLDGGAFNCHVPQFRFGEPIGIAPCWALGRLTTAGGRSPAPATS